jgi:hypothetical protein
VAVGDEVELAPRDPDPAATYDWRLAAAPAGSAATLGDDPVEHFEPDAPGRYRVELAAPDGTHTLTVRAYPGHLRGTGPADGPYGRSGDGTTETETTPAGDGESGDHRSGEAADAEEDAPAGPGGRPRLSLSTELTDESVVVRAEASGHPDGSETAADLAVEFLLDDRDSLARADVHVDGPELRIPRAALPELARVHAVAVGEHGFSVPDAVEVERSAAGEGVETADGDQVETRLPYHPPDWARDATIYEVYIRTFPGQDADLAGSDRTVFDALVDRLDYIADLGVDTLWLTPVLENDHAPHGYNVTDFFAVAEDLGTRADYERFLDEAHDRGLNVLFDLVCNHSARAHPYFQAAVADPNSEYREWYEWRGESEPETYFEWEYIANFDFDHLPVRRHLLDAVAEWAPLVDGFRCDMAWAVPNGFWREIHDQLKSRDADFLLLDETIPYIPEFQAGLFDVHFDSTTYAALRRVGNGEPAAALLDAVDERTRIGFPDHAGFMLYAENHDETRYLVECGRPAAEAALGALCTLPGAPMVYAGQEFGQRGKRDDLAWAHADEELRAHVRRLAAVRSSTAPLAATAALRRVDFDVREGAADRVVAFARESEGSADADHAAVVVALNFGDAPATVALDRPVGDIDLVTGESVRTDDGLHVDDVTVVPVTADR